MTTQEFSNNFDTLILQSGLAFNEYEKSLFLTQAQEQLIREWYLGINTSGAFEEKEDARALLYGLIKSYKVLGSSPATLEEVEEYGIEAEDIADKCLYVELPSLVSLILEECAYINYKGHTKRVNVMPVRHDQYNVIRDNPFKCANSRRVLKIDSKNSSTDIRISILVSKYDIESYEVRYLKTPNPIILVPLEDGLSINGKSEITECELGVNAHRLILERAIQIAVASKSLVKSNQ